MSRDKREPRPRRFDRAVDGIVLLDKPQGLSSNAALQQARVIFRALKAGHTGSLDPMATGMLPVCFGEATKVCGFLLDSNKSYRFVAKLGQRTDTGDADGVVIEERPVPALDAAQIEATLSGFLGEQTQIPPMYSALKHQGERLYELARRGEIIERAERRIRIDRLTALRWNSPQLEIEVRCSKGTYVRTLAEDIAAKLGTTAHLTALRRIEVDPFEGLPLYTLDELAERAQSGPESLNATLLPVDRALTQLPAVELSTADAAAIRHGQSAKYVGTLPQGSEVRLYGAAPGQPGAESHVGHFLGIGEIRHGAVAPKRLLAFKSDATQPSEAAKQ